MNLISKNNDSGMTTSEKQKLQEIKSRFEIVGNSPLLNRAIEVAYRVAPSEMSVLVVGESGTGKEVFSKIIHSISKRKHNPFIAINCGAIPAGTIDSELFGHEKGSFTSAIETRKGYFETVNGGTIFLDEIGELPLETQSRLLRLLENGEFLKVGSSKTQKTDVRVVAATNKDLLELAGKGKFREDLYYRLSTVTINLPSLRERREDIPYLWAKFSNDFSDKYRIPPMEISSEGMKTLQSFSWPGNIRQMRNIVEQVSILEQDRILDVEDVKKYLPIVPSSGLVYSGQPISQSQFSSGSVELMFNLMIEMKKEIGELRQAISNILHQTGLRVPSNFEGNNGVGGSMYSNGNAVGPVPMMNNLSTSNYPNYGHNPFTYPTVEPSNTHTFNQANDEEEHIDVVGEVVDNQESIASLSLIKNEKEMIIKALDRHKGKRRMAAFDLGISERTLYRKLKEYDLE